MEEALSTTQTLSISREENDESESSEDEDSLERSNLYGVMFMMWFEIELEGKDPMDQDEDDWRGRLEFWVNELIVSPDIFRGLFYDV